VTIKGDALEGKETSSCAIDDSTAEVNRRIDCRLIEGKKALKLFGATRDARARAH